MLDQANDLRQHRIGTDLGHAETERAGFVDRAADNFGAYAFCHRHRLTADHALVNIRGAFHNLAVDRNFLARTHEHDVTGGYLIEGNFNGFAVSLDPCGLGLQPHQPLDGLRGLAFGARLQRAPEQDQGHDHRRGFEIDVGGALWQHLRDKRCNQ
ncbi:hypothetical protein D3C84_944490 [compost metagenome]